MNTTKKDCLHCKHYRLDNMYSGVCRLKKNEDGSYPLTQNEDTCDAWCDCGQQYYIRKGWIKAQKDAERQEV